MESTHLSEMKSMDIKTEKTNAIMNNRKLQKITTVFRFMEVSFFLAIISRFSPQLLSAVKVAGDYFRESNFTAFSPKFVFVIGNLIILILFLRSRAVENSDEIGKADLCYEYAKSCDRSIVNCTDVTSTASPANIGVASTKRKISRSKTENPIVKCRDKQAHGELRLSVTEIGRSKNSGDGDKSAVEKSYVKEELSCEDFRRTVEAFIARQQKILRDEEFAPMVYMGS